MRLVKEDVYKSKDYGLVKYMGTCRTNRGGAGFCYKFETPCPRKIKYIDPNDLKLFLEEDHEL
jgi:hypothetical protein